MNIVDRDEVKAIFQYPILEAIARRRSRRFPQGCVSPQGALHYVSQKAHMPLNELETAVLCWSGAGITGGITGDLPTRFMGNTFGSWIGRATPFPCNIHNTKLFFTNDNGTFVYNPNTNKATKPVEIETEADREKIMTCYKEDCIRVMDERVEFLPKALGDPMNWNINKPGTTVFIPVVDQAEEYINFMLSVFDREGFGYRMFDDIHERSAGLQEWIDKGMLKGPEIPLTSLENSLMFNCLAPAYFMLENIHLVAEAMGIGAVMFGGYTGKVMLGITPMSKGLGFRAQTGRNRKPNPVGLDGVFEAYCPPYYKNMDDAVDAFIERKFGPGAPYTDEYNGISAFKDRRTVIKDYNRPSDISVDQVKSFFSYIYETYGRIPVTSDTKLIPVWLQVHHLDLDFYENHFEKSMISDTHRTHMRLWHAESFGE